MAVCSFVASGENTPVGQKQRFVQGCTETVKKTQKTPPKNTEEAEEES